MVVLRATLWLAGLFVLFAMLFGGCTQDLHPEQTPYFDPNRVGPPPPGGPQPEKP